MNKKVIIIICLFVQTVFLSAQLLDLTEPLPVDKDFIVGKLENGLTYYIRETNLSKDKADFFIVHNVGSLQEEENQRGLAHFLEHMAFNGTKHFPGNNLINYFESLGVRFAVDVNAYTSMSRTVYNISEVPISRSTVIDSTLLALYDWSHYINCYPEDIEKERGIVREEMRRKDEPLIRMLEAVFKAQQTGARFAERAPIGLAEVVENFEHKDLIDFYHKWYRPNEQAVLVVGDIDAKDIEQRIIERFSAIPNPDNEEEKLYYSVPDNTDPIISFFTDPEIKSKSVRISVKIPHRSVADKQTHAFLYDILVDDLFLEMFKSRCAESAKKPNADFEVIVPVYGEIDYACKIFTATAVPAYNKNLFTALKGILEEVERVKQYGISDLELENAKRIVRANLQKKHSSYIQKAKNRDLVSLAVDNFTRNHPLVNQLEYFELALSMLDKIKVEDINDNIERILNENNRIIIFVTPESEKESLPTTEKVISLVKSIQNKKLEQYAPKSIKELFLSEEIEAGKVLESCQVSSEDLGIKYKVPLDSTTELRLNNGARVIWKESYGNDEKVRLSAFTLGGYARSHSIEDIDILKNYMRYFNIANLNRDELREWRGFNRISLSSAIHRRTDNYSGSFYPENSERFFKLLYSYFTDISVNKVELEKFKHQYFKNIRQEKNDDKMFRDSIKILTYSSNPLKTNMDSTYIQAITPAKLNKLYQDHFSNPSEYTFVFTGPMSVNDAKPMIEKYIASIPVSDRSGKKKLVSKDPILEKGNVQLHYKAENTITSKAFVSVVYHSPIEYNTVNYINNLFLRDILSKRYHNSIREEKGGTYHVAVKSSLNKYPFSQLVVNIDFETRSSMLSELLEAVQHEVDLLLKYGPTSQEIDEIKIYRSKVLEDNKSIPWSEIITQSLLNEPFIDVNDSELIDQVSTSSVHKLIKTLFTSGNKMSFVFDPNGVVID